MRQINLLGVESTTKKATKLLKARVYYWKKKEGTKH